MKNNYWEVHYVKSKILSDDSLLDLFYKISVMDETKKYSIYIDNLVKLLQKLSKTKEISIASLYHTNEILSFVLLKGVEYQPICYNKRHLKLLKIKGKLK